MTRLVLKLAPRERILINGVLVENGNRTNRLCVVTPDTAILRLRNGEGLVKDTTQPMAGAIRKALPFTASRLAEA